MGYRLSKIYTKTGDKGLTGLGTGERVAKNNARVAAYGDIDELNSHMGLLAAQLNILKSALSDDKQQRLLCLIQDIHRIQHELFNLGGELCIPQSVFLTPLHVSCLEQHIDTMNIDLKPLKNFILPAGNVATCQIHVTRTVCRRAERGMWALQNNEKNINSFSLQYINRLSDWLFVLARYINFLCHLEEMLWQSTP